MSQGPGQAGFSTLWENIFHSVEKPRISFPYCGKWGRGGGCADMGSPLCCGAGR